MCSLIMQKSEVNLFPVAEDIRHVIVTRWASLVLQSQLLSVLFFFSFTLRRVDINLQLQIPS